MAELTLKIDHKKFSRKLRRLLTRSSEATRVALENAAEAVLREARKRAPFRLGELRDSDFSGPVKSFGSKASVRIGFSKPYAHIMDQGWGVRVIRPKKAKALFIPINRRGARGGPIKGTRLGQGKVGRDFVFATRVPGKGKVLPEPRKGRRKGPNFFFSGTLEDMSTDGRISRIMGDAVLAFFRRESR